MKVKLTRYSTTGKHGRKMDKNAEVDWTITATKNGYINIQIETGHVYSRKINPGNWPFLYPSRQFKK